MMRHGVTEPRHVDEAVTHDYMVLSFFTAGSATIELESHWSMRAGDVLLIPAGSPHRLTATEHPEIWGLGFCPVCFVADGSESLLEPFERVRSGASAVVTIPESRRPFLERLLEELQRELGEVRDGTVTVQKSLTTLILAEVSRATTRSEQAPANDATKFVTRRLG